MVGSSDAEDRNRKRMDGETAMAFAADQFERLHPRETCPEWLPRCTMISYHFDDDRNYIVSFAVTPLATNNAVRYFEVFVNASTGETFVLVDEDSSRFVGSQLQGYAAAARQAGKTMSSTTELKVVDVARLSEGKAQIVLVEIIRGGPSVNMQLTSHDAPGRWQIVGFGHIPVEYVRAHPNSMNLSIVNLEEENEIRAGINLVEAI